MTTPEKEIIQLMALVYNDAVRKSDAVICLQGDGYERVGQTVKLYQEGLVKYIVISGGVKNSPAAVLTLKMAEKIRQKGVAKSRIIIEENSQNTRDQGVEVMKLAKKNNWQKIILVASHFHQPRAYLTFLKTMQGAKLKIQIFNAPARELSWFDKTLWGPSRLKLLMEELKKIAEYKKKGHVANFEEAIAYQAWKEKQK
ncbi:MAG: YdcF family protein [bacterium]|nr:YdcF family protein [bacterium]